MPFSRKNSQPDRALQKEGVLKDNDEVFYLEMSKEIFSNYEDYFDRIMLLNSTVWTCALTSRPNLTYAEALESESEARRVLRRFPAALKGPIIHLVNHCTERRRISDLVEDVMSYLSARFLRHELVNVLDKEPNGKELWRDCEVLDVLLPAKLTGDVSTKSIDASEARYKVRRIADGNSSKVPEAFVANAHQVRRPRTVLTKDKLKLFLKQCVECNGQRVLNVKAPLYDRHVRDAGLTDFARIWPGKAPEFTAPRAAQSKDKKKAVNGDVPSAADKKKPSAAAKKLSKASKPDSKENKIPAASANKSKDRKSTGKAAAKNDVKHADISNYFVKNDGSDNNASIDKTPKAPKISKEELLRMRKEKEEAEAAAKKQAVEERERQRLEINQLYLTALRTYNRIVEDLELPDQRPLPVAHSVRTLIPDAFFSDALIVLEFLCSFQSVLECTDKFPSGYSLPLLERSLLCREVAGPLSDTIQVLLGTVFSLQLEEANEVAVAYVGPEFFDNPATAMAVCSGDPDVDRAVRDASLATAWSRRYLSSNLSQLPMDANTVSELLRLHLLTSGAREDDECARWRYQQRGGYRNVDDPGLALRVKHPHIVRHLAERTVYELEAIDVLRILLCLVNQIVTYSTVRDMIDERMESAQRARIQLRSLVASEKRRESSVQAEQRQVYNEMKKILASFVGSAAEKAKYAEQLQLEVDEKVRILEEAQENEKAKIEFQEQALAYRQQNFSYQLLLGVDRAHRTYWLFESLPGLLIERPTNMGGCPERPLVEHNATLAQITNDVERNKYIRQMTTDRFNATTVADKENQNENGTGRQSTETAEKPVNADTVTDANVLRDLMMCTGSERTCPVHGTDDGQTAYTFLHTEAELDALIAGLNSRGVREKQLKEQLESDRDLILNHIKDCKAERLQLTDEMRPKIMAELDALPNYTNASLGFPADTSVADVSEGTIVDYLAELERRVTEGHLGIMRVGDLVRWRTALTQAADDGQSDDLRWGPNGTFRKDNRAHPIVTDNKTNDDKTESIEAPIVYADPGSGIPAGDAKSETDADDRSERIYHIARSLLQIAQSLDTQFLRPPFGPPVKLKDANAIRAAKEKGEQALCQWQVSLMNATSYAQVFLHYTILEDAILWSRSTLNAVCKVCRRRGMPEKMLLCDGCNAGRHLFCFKPKMTKVPNGEWFCELCKPLKKQQQHKRKKTIRKVFSIDSGDEDDLSSEDEAEPADGDGFYKYFDHHDSEDMSECVKCETYTTSGMMTCDICLDRCHMACCRPIIKKQPPQWLCETCERLSKKEKRRLKRESHSKRMRERASRAVRDKEFDMQANGESDEYEHASDVAQAPTKRKKTRNGMSAAAPATVSLVGRKRTKKIDPEFSYDDEEDFDANMSLEVMPQKKNRSLLSAGRLASAVGNGKRRRQSIDADDDSDFESSTSTVRRSRSSRRNSVATAVPPAKKKRTGGVGLGRQSAAKNDSTGDDEDDFDESDDEDNEPLVLNGNNSRRRTHNTSLGKPDDEYHASNLDTVACYDLLKLIAKHRDAWPFERAVNRHDVPDYYLVIERPMDLAKIKSKLNMGGYRTNNEIMRDVQQIFENCDLYNTNGSEIYNAGVMLEQFVQQKCAELNLPFKPSDMLLVQTAKQNKENRRKSTSTVPAKVTRKSRT